MRTVSRTIDPEPPRLGVLDGLAYALFTPPARPIGGVVILHGADSVKESHYDFARHLRSMGIASVCVRPARPRRVRRARWGRACSTTWRRCGRCCRPTCRSRCAGSSMGGWVAIGRGRPRRRRRGRGDLPGDLGRAWPAACATAGSSSPPTPALAELVAAVDLDAAASRLGERLLLLHAEGDETVPVEVSRHLHEITPGSRLVVTPGGHHRSIQHDPELQAFAARWLQNAFTSF